MEGFFVLNKVLYDAAVANNIPEFGKLFNINIDDFVNSVTSQQSLHFPEDHFESPLDAANNFKTSKFNTPELVLEAGRHIIAHSISVHPQLKAFIRRVYFSDAVITVAPTEKGIKEIEQHHPYYVIFFIT